MNFDPSFAVLPFFATDRAHRSVIAVVLARPVVVFCCVLFLCEVGGAALGLADEVVVLEIFAPGETPIPGVSGQTMAAQVPLEPTHVVFEPSWSAVAGQLAARAKSGDVIMTLGAGDIGMIGLEILDILRERG